ncbi:MAG: fimbria/pilus periplasmic chaperone [Gammaproteobacteria bacterium]|nr:fimbria/pilus periplasmic chaperone [Gammaproteobacteria bacterium]
MKIKYYIVRFGMLAALFIPVVSANVLEVTPVQLSLSPSQRVGVLKVTNRSGERSILQLSLLDWQQSPKAKDIYKISHDILLTPPLFVLPAHKTQIIRFALKHPTYNTVQKAYRVHLKEVQQPRQKKLGQTLYFLMDISLPLFVQPLHMVENAVWSIKVLDAHHMKLNLYNDGNISLFVNQWQLFSNQPPGHSMKKHSTFTYVLPRCSYSWIVKDNSNINYTDILSNINGHSKKSSLHRL